MQTNTTLNPSANKELAQESHLQTNTEGSQGESCCQLTRSNRISLEYPFRERESCSCYKSIRGINNITTLSFQIYTFIPISWCLNYVTAVKHVTPSIIVRTLLKAVNRGSGIVNNLCSTGSIKNSLDANRM